MPGIEGAGFSKNVQLKKRVILRTNLFEVTLKITLFLVEHF